MTQINRILIVLIGATLLACGSAKQESSNEKQEQPNLKEQVMAVHDEIMPKMGELRTVKKDLLVKAEAEADTVIAQNYRDLANQMDAASESMMIWMRNYNPNFEGTEEELETYLNEQKKVIEQVKADMLKAAEAGRKALEE